MNYLPTFPVNIIIVQHEWKCQDSRNFFFSETTLGIVFILEIIIMYNIHGKYISGPPIKV